MKWNAGPGSEATGQWPNKKTKKKRCQVRIKLLILNINIIINISGARCHIRN